MRYTAPVAFLALAFVGCVVLRADAQATPPTAATPALRNSSTLPLARPSVVIEPWDNHHRYAPIVVPVGTTISFIWENDDHGVFLLNNDQCPTNFTSGAGGQEELYPITAKNGGLANYTTALNDTGIYYFACQQGIHCLQGQRLEVTVYNATQGIPGTVTAYGPGPGTSQEPPESHSLGRK